MIKKLLTFGALLIGLNTFAQSVSTNTVTWQSGDIDTSGYYVFIGTNALNLSIVATNNGASNTNYTLVYTNATAKTTFIAVSAFSTNNNSTTVILDSDITAPVSVKKLGSPTNVKIR